MTCQCNLCKCSRGEITPQAFKDILIKEMPTYDELTKDEAMEFIVDINNGTFLEESYEKTKI